SRSTRGPRPPTRCSGSRRCCSGSPRATSCSSALAPRTTSRRQTVTRTVVRTLWTLLVLIVVAAFALLALRAYNSLGGPALEPWPTYVPTELHPRELDQAHW